MKNGKDGDVIPSHRDDMSKPSGWWCGDMRWTIAELTVGWPPSVKIVRAPGDDEALRPLFLRLSDKRLLRFGYGPSAGITTLDDSMT